MTDTINYHELSSELDQILSRLQSEEVALDEAVQLYERGIAITKLLERYLKQAENKVQKIKAELEP